MKRRDFLTLPPALAASVALPFPAQAEAEDPIMPAYREWLTTRTEWKRLMSLASDDEMEYPGPEILAAEARWDAAFKELMKLEPKGLQGIAALSHVWLDEFGPLDKFDSELAAIECAIPENRIVAAIWRVASGREGLPHA